MYSAFCPNETFLAILIILDSFFTEVSIFLKLGIAIPYFLHPLHGLVVLLYYKLDMEKNQWKTSVQRVVFPLTSLVPQQFSLVCSFPYGDLPLNSRFARWLFRATALRGSIDRLFVRVCRRRRRGRRMSAPGAFSHKFVRSLLVSVTLFHFERLAGYRYLRSARILKSNRSGFYFHIKGRVEFLKCECLKKRQFWCVFFSATQKFCCWMEMKRIWSDPFQGLGKSICKNDYLNDLNKFDMCKLHEWLQLHSKLFWLG